jgi:hypothetical protein
MAAQRQTALPFGDGVAAAPAAADAPAEDRAAKVLRGTLTHGRQKEIIRSETGLMNLVHNWDNRSIVSQQVINKMQHSQKNLITEHMKPIYEALKKAQHLTTVKGQFRGLFETAASEPVRCWEKNGEQIEKLMHYTVGDMSPRELKVKINDSTLGKLNKYVSWLRAMISEETDEKVRCDRWRDRRRVRACAWGAHACASAAAHSCTMLPWRVHSGADVIHDRIAFAGANWKPLLQLRDAWATEASTWLNQRSQLKRACEREEEATRAAEARAEALSRRVGAGAGPPAKRMRVRSAQVAKEKYPGSLTVNPGDTCILVEPATNPLWARVKMDDDGRTGIISASKLEDVPEEAPLPDPSDDELPDPSDDEEAAAARGAATDDDERLSLEAVESAIEAFYESVGGDLDVTFSAADIREQQLGCASGIEPTSRVPSRRSARPASTAPRHPCTRSLTRLASMW